VTPSLRTNNTSGPASHQTKHTPLLAEIRTLAFVGHRRFAPIRIRTHTNEQRDNDLHNDGPFRSQIQSTRLTTDWLRPNQHIAYTRYLPGIYVSGPIIHVPVHLSDPHESWPVRTLSIMADRSRHRMITLKDRIIRSHYCPFTFTDISEDNAPVFVLPTF
jgi:hypothetical protein